MVSNDDAKFPDPGSANSLDSFLFIDNAVAGQKYYIEVSDFTGMRLPAGSSYDLVIAQANGITASGTVLRGATLDGGPGNDVLVGSAGVDWLFGGTGADTLEGKGGDDLIAGGDGTDIAVYSALHTAYAVTVNADGSLRISGDVDGVDTVSGIEAFRFADGVFRWDGALGRFVAQGSPPTVDPAQAIAVTEDASVPFNVAATDPEGDPLTWFIATAPLHGVVTGGAGGGFVYAPFANYNGSDQFVIGVRDSGTATSLQAVTVAVAAVNDAPVLAAASQSLVTVIGTSRDFSVAASDVDGDPLNFIPSLPTSGTVTNRGDGSFTYRPNAGFFGTDTFTVSVSDSRGGVAVQQVDVMITPPSAARPGFRAFLADGFSGGLGGSGQVNGTNGFQDLTLLNAPGAILLDASFNRGGEVIRLPGAAAGYRIAQAGSTAVLIDEDSSYTIPAGPAGTVLVFADGARMLAFDAGDVLHIGSQQVTPAAVGITAPPQPGIVPAGGDPAAPARIYMNPGGQVETAGKAVIVGTAAAEDVTWRSGDLSLDASFNRGGDILHLGQSAQQFTAWRNGSGIVLVNGSGQISIPLGAAGIVLDFAGEVRTARIDTQSLDLLIGGQVIDATQASPEPLASISSLALSFTAPGGQPAIHIDGNYTF